MGKVKKRLGCRPIIDLIYYTFRSNPSKFHAFLADEIQCLVNIWDLVKTKLPSLWPLRELLSWDDFEQ